MNTHAVYGFCPIYLRGSWFSGFDSRGPVMLSTAWNVKTFPRPVANSIRRYLQRSQLLSGRRRAKFEVVDLDAEINAKATSRKVLDKILAEFPVMERREDDDAGDLYAVAERPDAFEVV